MPVKSLYLLLDEWDNDRNFVGKELELISQKYDVTVIANSASTSLNPNVKYSIYKRPGKLKAIISLLKMLFDKDALAEVGRVFKEDRNRTARLSETVRFYVNADLFGGYLKDNGFLKDDAIYYSYWFFWKCYAVTRVIEKYKGSKVITRTHEYDLYDYTSPSGYQPFKTAMDEKLDSIIFIAEHGRDYYLDKYNKEPGEKYKLYRLGTRREKKPEQFDGDNDLTDGNPVNEVTKSSYVFNLVSCSSIIPRKRVGKIAEALSCIDDIRIKWIHFGTGELEEEVKYLSGRLLNKTNIDYEFKGYVTNEELHKFYINNPVDVFINASSSEGNPVSVMEAMSYGIPVIAPDICNFPNMIRDCGILINEKCEAEDIAEAISKFCNMPYEQRRLLGRKAYECWDEKFNADKNDRRFVEEVLDSL
ncbi:MAG: glycosyltransferase [Lachnospiraceae bacterium]|nr:glycosyltransferase [Lachnospiraceae bacterium]